MKNIGMDQPLQYYFAYGSNLYREQMEQRCPKARKVGIAKLQGYALEFKQNYRGTGVANVRKEKGSRRAVVGAVYLVTPECIEALDGYEGHPRVYVRKKVNVWMDGEKIEAITYIMKPHFIPGIPSGEYLGKISKGYQSFGLNHKRLDRAVTETRERCIKQIEWRFEECKEQLGSY